MRYIYFHTSTPTRPDDQETTMDELAQMTHYVLEDDVNQPELYLIEPLYFTLELGEVTLQVKNE